jgi:hypothetical protein
VQVASPVTLRAPVGAQRGLIVTQARKYGVAAQVEAEAFDEVLEEPAYDEQRLEVEAAAVADESLKIVNCQLSECTVKVCEKPQSALDR